MMHIHIPSRCYYIHTSDIFESPYTCSSCAIVRNDVSTVRIVTGSRVHVWWSRTVAPSLPLSTFIIVQSFPCALSLQANLMHQGAQPALRYCCTIVPARCTSPSSVCSSGKSGAISKLSSTGFLPRVADAVISTLFFASFRL